MALPNHSGLQGSESSHGLGTLKFDLEEKSEFALWKLAVSKERRWKKGVTNTIVKLRTHKEPYVVHL